MSETKVMQLVADIKNNNMIIELDERAFVRFTVPRVFNAYIKGGSPLTLRIDDTSDYEISGKTILPGAPSVAWTKSDTTSSYRFPQGFIEKSEIELTAVNKADPKKSFVFATRRGRVHGGGGGNPQDGGGAAKP